MKIAERLNVALTVFLETTFFWTMERTEKLTKKVEEVWMGLSSGTGGNLGIVAKFCAHVALASSASSAAKARDLPDWKAKLELLEVEQHTLEANLVGMQALGSAGVAASRLGLFARLARDQMLKGLDFEQSVGYSLMTGEKYADAEQEKVYEK